MSILPLPTSPSPDGRPVWLSLRDAAERLGLSEGHTRRKAGDEWFPRGLARTIAGVWEIRSDADPLLASGQASVVNSQDVDIPALTARQRARLAERRQILADWAAARAAAASLGLTSDQATDRFLLSLQDRLGRVISRGTLYNWAAKARENDLVDGRSTPRQSEDEHAPFIDEVKRLWLRQSKPSLKACYDFAKLSLECGGSTPLSIPSLKTVERAIKSLDQRLVILKRFGASAFKDQVLPHHQRDYTTLQANECWVSDHMQFDVLVNIGTRETPRFARPWLTSWEDVRSRKIVGYNIAPAAPTSLEILIALKRGVLAAGIPTNVYMDNGKDYDSWVLQGQTKWERRRCKIGVDPHHFAGALGALGCTVLHAIPYNPESKPIEPWHRTVHARFDKFQSTYCGSTPAEKPEDLQARLDAGQAPVFADFVAAFADWLAGDYHQRGHSGQGMDGESPDQVWARTLTAKRTAPADHVELLLQRTSRPVKVTANGVTWGDRSYGRGDAVLDAHFGKEVYLRVGEDVTEVSVWTTEDRLIGRVRLNGLTPFLGATEDQFKEVARQRKRIKANIVAGQQAQMQVHKSVADLLAEQAQSSGGTGVSPGAMPPVSPASAAPRLRMHGSPFVQDDVVKALAVRPRKIAVGAESVDPSTGELLDLLGSAPEPAHARAEKPDYMSIYDGNDES